MIHWVPVPVVLQTRNIPKMVRTMKFIGTISRVHRGHLGNYKLTSELETTGEQDPNDQII